MGHGVLKTPSQVFYDLRVDLPRTENPVTKKLREQMVPITFQIISLPYSKVILRESDRRTLDEQGFVDIFLV